jgi:hypothetical protein
MNPGTAGKDVVPVLHPAHASLLPRKSALPRLLDQCLSDFCGHVIQRTTTFWLMLVTSRKKNLAEKDFQKEA